MEQEIIIAYATDESYLRYTATSAESVMRHLNPEKKVHFVMLISSDFSENSKQLLDFLPEMYKNCRISFRKMDTRFSHIVWKIPHITEPALYRLILPDILEDCEKCLYLDGDTIVCEDISPFYDMELKDNLIAGVTALAFVHGRTTARLEVPCADYYVNSGVLLMNLKEMRQKKKVSEFLSFVERDYSCIDQDILNKVCYGSILNINYKYNLTPTMAMRTFADFEKILWLEREFDPISEYQSKEQAISFPVIVHYADQFKPWNSPAVPMAHFWWYGMLTGNTRDFYKEECRTLLKAEDFLRFSQKETLSYTTLRMSTYEKKKGLQP